MKRRRTWYLLLTEMIEFWYGGALGCLCRVTREIGPDVDRIGTRDCVPTLRHTSEPISESGVDNHFQVCNQLTPAGRR